MTSKMTVYQKRQEVQSSFKPQLPSWKMVLHGCHLLWTFKSVNGYLRIDCHSIQLAKPHHAGVLQSSGLKSRAEKYQCLGDMGGEIN
eukprot:Em0001g3066a